MWGLKSPNEVSPRNREASWLSSEIWRDGFLMHGLIWTIFEPTLLISDPEYFEGQLCISRG